MNNKTGLWIIAAFVIMIFCFAVANATSTYGRVDGQIMMQNNVIDFVANANQGVLVLTYERIDADTLQVVEQFTVADTATFTVSCDATFAANLSVGDSVYVDTILVVGNDAVITDSLYIGGNCVVIAILSAEHLTSTDDADIADSLYVGGNIVGADSLFITNMVQAEQLTSTDDATITDDIEIGGDATVTGTVQAEHIYSTDDAVIADSLYVGDDLVVVDSIYAGGNIGVVGTIDGATINTGQGDNELYDMDQNVLTTSTVTFADMVLDSLYFRVGTVTADLAITGDVTLDSLYAGSDVVAVALVQGEQITSTDDGIIADSLYIGGNTVIADSLFVTNMVQAEHLYSTDDAVITDDLSVGGETTLSGGVTFNVTTVDDTVYTVLVSDYIIDISHTDTADTVHVTIPTALISAGKRFEIWDTEFNAGTNNIIIGTEGAELINEAAADTISANGGKRLIWSDGTNWFSRE